MKILIGEGEKTGFASIAALIIALSLFSCTGTDLTPYTDPNDSILVNNRISLKGTLCNQEPGTDILPVKILFVLDHSGSLGPFPDTGTDPDTSSNGGSSRQNAVRAVLDQFATNPAYWFGQILFSNRIEVCPNPGGTGSLSFLNLDRAGYQTCIDDIHNPHNETKMYEGLVKAYNTINKDLINTPTRLQRRTTYIIILFTDGVPDDGVGDCYFGTSQAYPGQPSFGEIPENITKVASDIMTLADDESDIRAKEIIINTVFLNTNTLTKIGACPGTNLQDQARSLLSTIASIGNGIFFETGTPENLDFLQFVRTTIKSVFGMKSFVAANLNARVSGDGRLLVDTDGDGLSDEYETSIGLNPREKDTDGDGLSDKIELRLGMNPKIPDSNCQAIELVDTDFDGLNDCEERYLGTDSQLPDTDADGMLDFLEVIYDTDPLVRDSNFDNNQDGVTNGSEMTIHTEPNLALSQSAKDNYAYRYLIDYKGLRPDLIDCYDFTIGNISLVKPLSRPGIPDGLNDILLYYIESLTDDPDEYGDATIGRYQAIYIGAGYKYPQAGQFEVDFGDFNVVNKFFQITKGY